jgi:P-type E1-E2 ATPase
MDQGYSHKDLIVKSLVLITITVPPILPAAMTIGSAYSLYRLQTKKLHCIAPSKVNVSGQVKVMVLDKTGTLTEDSL